MLDVSIWIKAWPQIALIVVAIGLTLHLSRVVRKFFAAFLDSNRGRQVLLLTGSVVFTLAFIVFESLFTPTHSWESVLRNILAAVLVGVVSTILDIVQRVLEETRRVERWFVIARKRVNRFETKMLASRIDPGIIIDLRKTYRDLGVRVNNLREVMEHRSAEIERLARRDKQMTQLIETVNCNIEDVSRLCSQARDSGSELLIHLADSYVRDSFTSSFSIGSDTALIEGQKASFDAYRALWELLLEKQNSERDSIVVRTIHAAEMSIWSAGPRSEAMKDAGLLIELQGKFVAAGGRLCRIVVNRCSPGSDKFLTEYRPLLDRMKLERIDVAYVHHSNKGGAFTLPKFPRRGFAWSSDFMYAQGWSYHGMRGNTHVIKTNIVFGPRANSEHSIMWDVWRSCVERMSLYEDKRLLLPEGVEII